MNQENIDLARKIVADFNAIDTTEGSPDNVAQLGYDLALAVVAWAETAGQAGTHAYDLMASYAQRDADVTESLIHLTAATVLAKAYPDERISVSFSPIDMDATFRDYDVAASRDGLITTVRITPKPPGDKLMTQDEDVSNAAPQAAEHVYDRPVWAIRYYDGQERLRFARMQDRADAERQLPSYNDAPENETLPDAAIENRMCLHVACPSDRCVAPVDAWK